MLELEKGKSISELMESVGKNCCEEIIKRFVTKGKNFVILCGSGNNGGDGFCLARYLKRYVDVSVIFLENKDNLDDEAKTNYFKILGNVKNDLSLIKKADFLIDAILGTGIKGSLREPIKNAVNLYNDSKAFKIAIDVPSGIDPDGNENSDLIAIPDLVFAIHDIKKGALDYEDKTIIVDIGLK